MSSEFDLMPDPRVLQMLGEINLAQWRCLAELIDNSIDSFIVAGREGHPIHNPEIVITVPTKDDETARVAIRDNGTGMSVEQLEMAVKAGWSGRDSLSDLGLFGMGFNIATARLGLVTEVWTTRAGDPEYVGVRIDLDELRRMRTYRAARLTRPKADHGDHSTEVVIMRLKHDQRAYLARPNNLKTIRKHLGRTYSPLLQSQEVANLRLKLNGLRIEPRRHCIWNPERASVSPNGDVVSAVQQIDVQLAPRRYCQTCMRMLPEDETLCVTGGPRCQIVDTPRQVRGWLGLQRYLDETEFGIDFVRHGRKIEIGCKEPFIWTDGETTAVEYPIDDPRNRGRIVGEIHIDHCRVSYTKDRFERDDPAWVEMMQIIRGEGPLQPNKARQRGYSENRSPLSALFQAFRRSSPKGKNNLWSRLLVVKDNDRARQMAEAYANNEPEYLTDDRWWQLVEEQDRDILHDTSTSSGDENPTANVTAPPPGFVDEGAAQVAGTTVGTSQPPPGEPSRPARRPLHDLTRKFSHPTFRVEFDVMSFAIGAGDDSELPAGSPWLLRMDDVATRTYVFLVNADDDVFHSTTMTPLDALLTELAFRSVDFLKGQIQGASLAAVLSGFRQAYCAANRLDPREIIALSTSVLEDIARSLSGKLDPPETRQYFDELSAQEKESIMRRIASRDGQDHKAVVTDGRFLEFADPQGVRDFFNRHPELFLDGRYWEDSYTHLDYPSLAVTREAQDRVRSRYDAYLVDAVWLANQTSSDLERADRDALVRATCSLRLLRPDITS